MRTFFAARKRRRRLTVAVVIATMWPAAPALAAGSLECGPERIVVARRRHVPIACTAPPAAASATLYLKAFGTRRWTPYAMKRVDGTFRLELPCWRFEGSLGTYRWYIEAQDAQGRRVADLGSADNPREIDVVSNTSESPPHFPGEPAPAPCPACDVPCPPGWTCDPKPIACSADAPDPAALAQCPACYVCVGGQCVHDSGGAYRDAILRGDPSPVTTGPGQAPPGSPDGGAARDDAALTTDAPSRPPPTHAGGCAGCDFNPPPAGGGGGWPLAILALCCRRARRRSDDAVRHGGAADRRQSGPIAILSTARTRRAAWPRTPGLPLRACPRLGEI